MKIITIVGARPEEQDILSKLHDTKVETYQWSAHYGDGHASEKITELLCK